MQRRKTGQGLADTPEQTAQDTAARAAGAAAVWMNVHEVANYLAISPQHVYYMTDIGQLVGLTMGHKRLWIREDVETYVEELRLRGRQEAIERRARFEVDQAEKKAARKR